MARRDELIELIGNEIVNSRRLESLDWRTAVIVFDIGEGVVSNSGFAYLDERIVPIVASGAIVDDYVRELRDEIKLSDKAPFIQMLVQLRRSDGKMRVDFEYDDPSRWSIRPSKLVEMREALRPQFEN